MGDPGIDVDHGHKLPLRLLPASHARFYLIRIVNTRFLFCFLSACKAVAMVHHHWVTEAGDTIFAADATANAFQVGTLPGVYGVGDGSYAVNIIGGTGRFAGATGNLSFIGVLDTSEGKVVLRYQGEICFAQPEH